ncbi:MAG: hypothetical protein ACLF0P_06360 [Thermoanaerobaculia bacterium]
MPLGDKIRELDEHVAAAVRRAVDDLREEVRQRLDEATTDLQRRLGEVAPELPQSFVSEEHLRRIAEDAAAGSSEALENARSAGRGEGRAEGFATLRSSVGAVDRARSQAEILDALLAGASAHAARTAVLLVRDGRLTGWDARGFGLSGEGVRGVTLAAEDEPWAPVTAGEGPRRLAGNDCAPLVSQLESPLPRSGVALPLVLRDRVAALVYADRPAEEDRLEVEPLQVLTYVAALALETLAVRERPATATLEAPADPEEEATTPPDGAAERAPENAAEAAPAAEGTGAAAEPAPPEPPPPPPAAEEPAGPFLEEETPGLGEMEPEPEEPDVAAAPEATAGVSAEPSPEPVGEEEVDLGDLELQEAEPTVREEAPTPPHGDELLGDAGGDDLLQPAEDEAPVPSPGGAQATESLDPSALDETAFEEAPPLEDPAAAPEAGTQRPEEPGEPTDELQAGDPSEPAEPAGRPSGGIPWQTGGTEPQAPATQERPESGAVPSSAPPAPGSEVEPPGTPEAGGGPAGGEVDPPADVEGPGWAFSATRQEVAEDDEAAHEEARRLARLLVSEIQLYNQDAVEEGRRNRDIYERLKDDIDRSRELYDERVDSAVRDSTDYFYQELVRQLGAGDAKALGI